MQNLFVSFALATLVAAPVWAASQTVTLAVSKMTCAACPITVKTALSRVPGVTTINVNFEKKQVTVAFDGTKTNVAALTRATADAGFPSTAVTGAGK